MQTLPETPETESDQLFRSEGFGINAIFLRLLQGSFCDPYQSIEDCEEDNDATSASPVKRTPPKPLFVPSPIDPMIEVYESPRHATNSSPMKYFANEEPPETKPRTLFSQKELDERDQTFSETKSPEESTISQRMLLLCSLLILLVSLLIAMINQNDMDLINDVPFTKHLLDMATKFQELMVSIKDDHLKEMTFSF